MIAKHDRLRIVVLGYIVRGPLGGLAWHHLQYVLGLHLLGHDLHFVEDSGDNRWCCYDPTRFISDEDPTYGLSFASRAFDAIGLGERWAYHDAHGRGWLGPRADDAAALCRAADVVLDLGAVNVLRPWTEDVPIRVLVDTDPAFTQIKHLTDPEANELAARHTHFLTFAGAAGHRSSLLPDDGFPWQPTRQPMVLDAWPMTPPPPAAPFTTVMQWDSYSSVEHGGISYGMKSASFGEIIDLPASTRETFELAVGLPEVSRSLLAEKGWLITNPLEVALEPSDYQRFIQHSKGELSVAKHGYVVSRSGWFSERSAAYLASGRPVITQDTGFTSWLPTGEGLFAFTGLEDALAAVEEVACHHDRHCRAARDLAAEHFDAQTVLTDLLNAVTASQPGRATSACIR